MEEEMDDPELKRIFAGIDEFVEIATRPNSPRIVDRFDDIPSERELARRRKERLALDRKLSRRKPKKTKHVFDVSRVLSGLNFEVHQQFPPPPGRFQESAADILERNRQSEAAEKMRQESEWPLPPNFRVPSPPPVQRGAPSLDASNMFTRSAGNQPIWKDFHVNAAYLEERITDIFCSTPIQVIPPELRNMDDKQRRRYDHILTQSMTTPEENKSDYPIVELVNVYTQTTFNIKYAIFHVRRANNVLYFLTEADLRFVRVEDISFIFDTLSQKKGKWPDEEFGRVALMRYLRNLMEFIEEHDLQLGAENNYKRINLVKPNTSHPDLENLEELTVIDEGHESFTGERGVVSKNTKGEKIFIRLDELMSYSDGTLKILHHKIHQKVWDNRDAYTYEQHAQAYKAIDQMKTTISNRRQVRKWQVAFGIRNKSVYE